MKKSKYLFYLLGLFFIFASGQGYAEDELGDFDFSPDDFEKKALQWSGYIEGKLEHFSFNEEGSLYYLTMPDSNRSYLDRLSGALSLKGSYSFAKNSVHWLLKGDLSVDQEDYNDQADIYESYLRFRPFDNLTVEAGKQTYKWGTGYAWNPAAFLNRRKNPNDPNEDLEGFVTLESTWVRSFGTTLDSMAASVVILPVWEGVNEDFGREDNLNLAGKLYFLVNNTDIDLTFLTGDSRSTRYGVDFATNLSSNFAVHGEFAYVADDRRAILAEDGNLYSEDYSYSSYLLGMRYLSAQNITTIIEYYHNGRGYSEEEMNLYYRLVSSSRTEENPAVAVRLLEKAQAVSSSGYAAPQSGKNYGYASVNWQEPFDILYFTPGFTAMVNLDDKSWTITPQFKYTGFTNWEVLLRTSFLFGEEFSEYGEKSTENKVELRLRYFF